MRNAKIFCLAMMLAFTIDAFAQAGAPAKQATPAPAPSATVPPAQPQATPQPMTTFAALADRQVSSYEKNVIDVAEAMPADKYDFTPASLNISGAAYGNVRTFAQLIKHTATGNYRYWTAVTGEKLPENIKGTNGPDELKTKAEIIQFLKDSFAVGHRAAKTLTPENALEQMQFFRGTSPRLFLVSGGVIHAADEYGQMVEYLRMNGIVPPASRPQQ